MVGGLRLTAWAVQSSLGATSMVLIRRWERSTDTPRTYWRCHTSTFSGGPRTHIDVTASSRSVRLRAYAGLSGGGVRAGGILPRMSLQTAPRPSWLRVRRLVPAAFVVQGMVSLLVWFLVDDTREGAWSNTDFREWATLSALCATLLVVLHGLAVHRGSAALAVAVGCLLAVISGCAIFVGYAVLNSA